ncbi:unnamed protein product [Vicia faba]|uniref:Pentatricopeptide repeat-containing protein n=1 Tax=Vicia faba TaxID=3906 RepID=A0AAV0ZJX3_VICFA|nr:unnamed protein product [Vicia faba]
MISALDLYHVLTAVVPLYVAMILAYGSVKWWKIFTLDQCSGINRFVAFFAVPPLHLHQSMKSPFEADLVAFAFRICGQFRSGSYGYVVHWHSAQVLLQMHSLQRNFKAEQLFFNGRCSLLFPPLLKAVSKLSALTYGLEIHGLASKLGFLSDPFIQTALIAMYASCARIMDARLLFAKMSPPDAVAWNTIIDGYCQNGHFDDALSLFEDMKNSGVKPDFVILCTVLSACGHARNLSYGRSIHEFIKDNGLAIDSYLQPALINMYSNCGAIEWESL